MTMGISWLLCIFKSWPWLGWFLAGGAGIGGGHAGLFADDLVADSVGDGLLGVEEAVALRILANFLEALPGALGHDGNQRVFGFEDLLGLDFDVRRLPVHAAEG